MNSKYVYITVVLCLGVICCGVNKDTKYDSTVDLTFIKSGNTERDVSAIDDYLRTNRLGFVSGQMFEGVMTDKRLDYFGVDFSAKKISKIELIKQLDRLVPSGVKEDRGGP